jgi:hypothetical protein
MNNIIQLADHRPVSPIDERPNSGRLTAAPFFIERSNIVQAPIDIGVAVFWVSYAVVALAGFWISGWAIGLVVMRSLGL